MKYPKIDSIWKRDKKGRFTDELAREEYGYLWDCDWSWSEKLDGTNVRVIWEPGEGDEKGRVSYKGRTDNATLHPELMEYLHETLPASTFDARSFSKAILYGEGIGPKIQQGELLSSRHRFVLFDVLIVAPDHEWWMDRETVREIAESLSIKSAPEVNVGKLREAVDFVTSGFDSHIAEQSVAAEGLVLRPTVELHTRAGHRIITKLKTRDFK